MHKRRRRRPQTTTSDQLAAEWRAARLERTLVETLDAFASAMRLHDDCPSCTTDLAIMADRARALGVKTDVQAR